MGEATRLDLSGGRESRSNLGVGGSDGLVPPARGGPREILRHDGFQGVVAPGGADPLLAPLGSGLDLGSGDHGERLQRQSKGSLVFSGSDQVSGV